MKLLLTLYCCSLAWISPGLLNGSQPENDRSRVVLPGEDSVQVVSADDFKAKILAYKQKAVVLYVWATWEQPDKELKALADLKHSLEGAPVVVVTVAANDKTAVGVVKSTLEAAAGQIRPPTTFMSSSGKVEDLLHAFDSGWDGQHPRLYLTNKKWKSFGEPFKDFMTSDQIQSYMKSLMAG